MTPSARILVRLTPRGGRDAIESWRDGALHIRVGAPPLDGRANEALLRLLAHALGLPASQIRIARGDRSRTKQVEVVGISQPDAERLLNKPPLSGTAT